MPKRKQHDVSAEADMTPMIDMTFQLIAFFMVLINFAEDNQNALVKLPSSELAKIPEEQIASPIVLQVSKEGKVVFNGDELPIGGPQLKKALLNEAQILRAKNLDPSVANIIIRGHGLVPTGKVQELIKVCQDTKFEKFSLRAEQGKPKADSDFLKEPKKPNAGIRG
ncbi:MAG TPA: biopolymer transporter ExbD [Pirellulales bacterium]|jgi:biopolymer transport protein ExbD|nr:biopolymer transporter ExbD [Pirellulales bacterium]